MPLFLEFNKVSLSKPIRWIEWPNAKSDPEKRFNPTPFRSIEGKVEAEQVIDARPFGCKLVEKYHF